MDSLTTAPVRDVLTRLFAEAAASEERLRAELDLTPGTEAEVIAGLIEAERRDYRGMYHRVAGHFLSVSPELGRFLYVSARACGARNVVEFGTSFGVSTIHLAAAVRDNGGGRVISTELEPEKARRARAHLAEAGLAGLVDVRVGDALDTLREDVGDGIDLVLLDGAFTLYRPVLDLLEPHLRPGALVVGENAHDDAGGYLEHVRDPANGYLSLSLPFDPVRANELTVRTR